MIIEVTLIQNFLIALIMVSVLVILGFLVKSILKKHEEIKSDEPDLATGYKKIIKTANKQAKSILYETTVEASNILTGIRKTNEKIEENLDTVLQSIAQKDIQALKETTANFDKQYGEKMGNIQEQIDQNIKQVIENTQNAYNERLDKFTNDLLKSGLSTQEKVDKKTAELVSIAESEIEEYKKSQFEKIETDAKNLLEKVYKDVLRINIPESLHRDLILKSLEDAKRDGIFKL